MQGQLYKWVCYAVGYVFIISGMMKLIVPGFKGMFASLGLPFPEFTLFLVAIVELTCGMLIAGRMYVKFAAPPLIIIMIGAIAVAKVPVITDKGLLSFAFEARLDVVMLILLLQVWHLVK